MPSRPRLPRPAGAAFTGSTPARPGGFGVYGLSVDGTGVAGVSASGVGVLAKGGYYGLHAIATGNSNAVFAESSGGAATILALAGGAAAIVGVSEYHTVIADTTGDGCAGLDATDSSSSGGFGVRTTSFNGAALDVHGRAQFSSSGVATVAAAHSSVVVTSWPVTSSSQILATMQTHRAGIHIEAATPDPASGHFTIYLSGTVSAATNIAWFVLN